jgi:hypothetical protein
MVFDVIASIQPHCFPVSEPYRSISPDEFFSRYRKHFRLTVFSYDGLGRRWQKSSTPTGGGGATVTRYVWCGSTICQSRDNAGAVTRRYLAEGDGIDQIGSVRRVFVSTSNAPAYDYDPYGKPLQVTAQLTNAGYAGMMTDADSGLRVTVTVY